MKFKIPILFILFFIFTHLFGQKIDSLNRDLKLLPMGYFTPETKLGLGAFFYTFIEAKNNKGKVQKFNSQTYLSYTLNKQFSFENDFQLWTKNKRYFSIGAFSFSRFPEFFFGIGNNTKITNMKMLSFDIFKFQTKNLMQIKKQFFVGVNFQYQKLYNQNIVLTNEDRCMQIFGANGFTASGFGPMLMIDNRNNTLNPEKGEYIETSFQFFSKSIGSNYNYSSFIFDARKYKTLWKKIVWNANLYIQLNNGEVPYRMMPSIGGARFLRGYYLGRFRDNNMYVAQHEFRIPVFKKIGIALFNGFGAVANAKKDFKTNTIHANYGVGLRFKINKKENTNIRIDYGITKDSNGLYIVFAEAF